MASEQHEVTELLAEWRRGDSQAIDRLMPLVYAELRHLADRHLRRERPDHTYSPTDLVHEAYLRMVGKTRPQWRDRLHFYAVAATVMRRVLVDYARRYRSQKRGGGALRLTLDDAGQLVTREVSEVLSLDRALESLKAIDARKSRVVELRFFGGLTIEETARLLGISTATVITDTRVARAWLSAEMGTLATGEAL